MQMPGESLMNPKAKNTPRNEFNAAQLQDQGSLQLKAWASVPPQQHTVPCVPAKA